MANHVSDRRPSLAVPFGLLGALGSYVIMSWLQSGQWKHFEISGVVLPTVVSVLIGLWLDRRAERAASAGWAALLIAMFLGGPLAGVLVGLSSTLQGAWVDSWRPDWEDRPLLVAVGALFGGISTLAFVPTFSLVFAAWRRMARARVGSALAKSDRQRLWLATAVGASIYALGMFGPVMEPLHETQPLALYVALCAVVVAVCGLVADVRRQRRIAGLTRDLVESPDAVDDDATFDLGVGEERWTLERIALHPYRAVPHALSRVRGSIDGARRALRTSTALSAAALVVTVGALVCLPPHGDAMSDGIVYAAPAEPMPPPASCSGYSWYNSRLPIPVDVNGDGVDDIVGLRWNSAADDRSLAVAAVDGVSHRELWCKREIPSQWGSHQTRLIHSGDHVYLVDSEGLLHVYRLDTGEETIDAMSVPPMRELCAGANGRLWYRFDYESAKGWEIGPDGTRRPADRPSSCYSTGPDRRATCLTGTEAKGRPGAAVPSQHREAGRVFLYDPPTRLRPAEDVLPELAAFSDETCEELWRTPIAFARDPLHRDPQMKVMAHGDLIYTYYQLRDGSWRLGARDGATGEVLWVREPARTDRGSSFHTLTATDQRLYVGLEWRLDIHDARTGEALGSVPM